MVKNVDKYQLKTAVWEITMQCNMKCIHCGTGSTLEKRGEELNTDEALKLIQDLVSINCEKVTLAGGEPFVRKDWPLLAESVLKNKMKCAMISNGLLIDKKVVAKLLELQKLGTIFIAVSIDGLAEIHNKIRNHPKAFSGITKALNLLSEANFPVSILTQVNNINFDELPKIQDFIFSYKNIYAWQIQVASPWGRAKEQKDLIISPNKYLKLVNYIAEQKQIHGKRVVAPDDIGFYGAFEEILRGHHLAWQGCHAGKRVVGIRSNGDITGCLSLMEDRFIEGNIRETSFPDIWNNPNSFAYNRQFDPSLLEGQCKTCKYGERCKGGCKNTALSLSGSFYKNDYCVHHIMNSFK